MYENKFSKWVKWNQRAELNSLNLPGIYAIAYSTKSLSNKPFSWKKEICYIGMTNSINGLKGRLRQFDTTIKRNKKSLHGGAERFCFKFKDYDALVNKLYISVRFYNCDVKSNLPDDLNKMGNVVNFEYSCLAQYVRRFKQLPEFNDKKRSPKK